MVQVLLEEKRLKKKERKRKRWVFLDGERLEMRTHLMMMMMME